MKNIILILFLILSIFSCSGKKEVNENEITVVFHSLPTMKGGEMEGTGLEWDFMQKIVAERMPGTTLKLAPIQAPAGEYYTKVALALKNENIYDIVLQDSFMLQSDVAAGLLAPLDVENWEEWQEFYEGGKEASIIDGKVYTIPFNTANVGIWYNKELIKAIGIDPENWQPKNWAEILDVARKIKALGNHNGKEIIPFSANLSRAMGEATTMHTFLMLLYGTDDKLFENDKWIVESQGILDSLNFIKTLREEDLVVPNDILLTAGFMGYTEPYIRDGAVGLSMTGTWVVGSYMSMGLENWKDVYEYTGMPTMEGDADRPIVTLQGGWGLSMPASSQKKEKALEVLKILTSHDSIMEVCEITGFLATRKDVGKTERHRKLGVNAKSIELLPYGFYRPGTEEYPSVSIEIFDMVDSVVSGTDPEKAMKLFAKNVEAVVGSDSIIKKTYK